MYRPCDVAGCDHVTPVPEDPDKLQGPEVGTLCIYNDPGYPKWDGMVVEVLRRSYVWSPEVHVGMNAHGYRHYDWSVIRYGQPLDNGTLLSKRTMVVDDDKLTPLEAGMRVAVAPEPEGER